MRSIVLMILVCSIAIPTITIGSEPISIPDGVEMIVWEHQSGRPNGGFKRLTIWFDGRTEVVVVPLRHSIDGQENLRPKIGWVQVNQKSPPHVEFVRRNIYPPDIARRKFKEALVAGIHLLKSFSPEIPDAGGTRIVIRIKGQDKENSIPMFTDREKGTLNHRRFLAVSDVLDGFDNSAYDVVPKVEMIIWEHQNWEPNGGYERLTIWRVGRSEVEVVPNARIPSGPTDLLPKSGWTAMREEHQVRFVRKDIYPPDIARAKLQQALEAGIQFLETFRPGYRDGSGTRVVVQINGKQEETVIPMFMDGDKGTVNYKRFVAVSKILSGFDANAYEMRVK